MTILCSLNVAATTEVKSVIEMNPSPSKSYIWKETGKEGGILLEYMRVAMKLTFDLLLLRCLTRDCGQAPDVLRETNLIIVIGIKDTEDTIY